MRERDGAKARRLMQDHIVHLLGSIIDPIIGACAHGPEDRPVGTAPPGAPSVR